MHSFTHLFLSCSTGAILRRIFRSNDNDADNDEETDATDIATNDEREGDGDGEEENGRESTLLFPEAEDNGGVARVSFAENLRASPSESNGALSGKDGGESECASDGSEEFLPRESGGSFNGGRRSSMGGSSDNEVFKTPRNR